MYNFRLATQNDYNFLYNLNETTMKQYIVETYGNWDEEFQTNFFRNYFKSLLYQIILLDGKDIGCLSFTKNNSEIIINDIQLLPEYQGKGIGKSIFTLIINDSEKLKIPITLKVLKVNKLAQKFYEGLGFTVNTENETHYFMNRKPASIPLNN